MRTLQPIAPALTLVILDIETSSGNHYEMKKMESIVAVCGSDAIELHSFLKCKLVY